MKKVLRELESPLDVAGAGSVKAPGNNIVWNGADDDTRENASGPKLVLQALDYTENPVDIPNPDRGFYRPHSYVIPVEGGTPSFPDLTATITGTTVSVDARIVYMEFDLRNFSSNAPLNGRPIGPWSAPDATPPEYGTTQPITPAALDYVRKHYKG